MKVKKRTMENKAKVYQGIVCLEIASAYGQKWWYQGESLSYTPVLVNKLRAVSKAVLEGSRKEVLVVALKIGNTERLIAVNIPRSDIAALKARRLWPAGMPEPFTSFSYTPWPSYTKNDPKMISIK